MIKSATRIPQSIGYRRADQTIFSSSADRLETNPNKAAAKEASVEGYPERTGSDSSRSVCRARHCGIVGSLWRRMFSVRAISLDGNDQGSVVLRRHRDSGRIRVVRQFAAVGLREAARGIRCSVFRGGAGRGQGEVRARADAANLGWWIPDCGWRHGDHVLEGVGK